MPSPNNYTPINYIPTPILISQNNQSQFNQNNQGQFNQNYHPNPNPLNSTFQQPYYANGNPYETSGVNPYIK